MTGFRQAVGEARTSFSKLVRRAETGEEIAVRRGSEPVARIMPLKKHGCVARKLADAFRAMRQEGAPEKRPATAIVPLNAGIYGAKLESASARL